MRKLYNGKQAEVYERATSLLKGTPHERQLNQLYIAANIADILVTKPADLLVGETPIIESGYGDASPQQKLINKLVEENDLVQMIHESALANGYRGDSWIKERFGYRQDFSALTELGLGVPDGVEMEAIIEHVTADTVFPETSNGDIKKFKAVDIASVEYVATEKKAIPYLNVERHLPGYIMYERYLLSPKFGVVNNEFGYPVELFDIKEKVATGRDQDVIATGVPQMLVHHIPFKSTDDAWEGKGTLEAIESILYAINDRLVAIDYILMKHSDPILHGPSLGSSPLQTGGGIYIEVTKDDPTPGYLTWDGKLDGAFKELELLINMAFQISETPQFIFGTVLGTNQGGTGTSHTDGAAIKARFFPILTKVNRMKIHYDKALRDSIYNCQQLEINQKALNYEATYPTITWRDGLPVNEKEQAEIFALRTGNRPTLDVLSAIKRSDDLDDIQANEILARIKQANEEEVGTVDASIFNDPVESDGDDI